MQEANIQHVAVLGAGSMGHGIAEVAAIAGYTVSIRDIEQEYVDDGLDNIEWSLGKLAEKGQIDESAADVFDRVEGFTDLEAAVENADLVVEAVPERMELKKDTFAEVDEHAPEGAILASNTSGLSITEMAKATDRPEQVVGTHYFNPPVRMDLVEVVHGDATSDETIERAHAYVDSIGKTGIDVKKDVHGFVVNNVLVPFMGEAAWMLDREECTIQEADAGMVFNRGYPMGPFELNDYGGIDIAYDFLEASAYDVPPSIAAMVDDETLGRKTGKGFYDYEDGDGVDYEPGDGEGFDTLRIEARMINEAAKLVGNDVATPEDIDLGVRLGGRFPLGTCRVGDSVGLETVLDKLEALYEETGAARYEPADYLVELVEAGETGVDAGAGFYDYTGEYPYQFLNVDLDERGVLSIEFDRTERLNAFSEEMFAEVGHALEDADTDEVSCVVFEGAGDRAFSAGADITGFTANAPTEIMDVEESIERIYNFDRPTIAAIDGFCLGGGFELMLACDLRLATESSTFGSPEVDLGLIPGGGGTQRLTRLVGKPRAKEIIFRGNHFGAERAEEWGIINRAAPPAEFDETVEEFVGDVASGPKTALKVAKQVINEGDDASLDAGLKMESQGFGLLTTTDDMLEGVQAFRNDREPNFED
ncbi:3-hydroxybutyryl-CoA dehydrogenase [Halobellus sp. Atlit-38R]|uniref:3-hydroxyacyl-CoA dehydrogenase/enoyl-CoA hydratase family protein n=1 Tax=Halobellus sp. Atlit-38R TaxID=2282131 RepID=UPI000EF188B2|nr:3-hydroxyacyl-CoA dehydrogenase NAD-binding domain-containing protein [Halobellus sp. Atlit-38R]RLM89260.1 3-hydroxybutyryl-CoA dehydrogenase [Halobellus sp. Atlit-38R]